MGDFSAWGNGNVRWSAVLLIEISKLFAAGLEDQEIANRLKEKFGHVENIHTVTAQSVLGARRRHGIGRSKPLQRKSRAKSGRQPRGPALKDPDRVINELLRLPFLQWSRLDWSVLATRLGGVATGDSPEAGTAT